MQDNGSPSVISHIVSILVLPFNVTVTIPALLLYFFGYSLFWGADMPFPTLIIMIGSLLILAGMILFISTLR